MKTETTTPAPKVGSSALVRLCNAITEAVREMEKCPDDSVQDIWNESLESWETGLRMDHNHNVEPNAWRVSPASPTTYRSMSQNIQADPQNGRRETQSKE
jgi:hypothetical protein